LIEIGWDNTYLAEVGKNISSFTDNTVKATDLAPKDWPKS